MNFVDLADWIWEATWQASLLVALVMVAQIVFRKWLSPAWRHALWALVVARLLLPVLPESPFSMFNVLPQRMAVDLIEPVGLPQPKPIFVEPVANISVTPVIQSADWAETGSPSLTNPAP